MFIPVCPVGIAAVNIFRHTCMRKRVEDAVTATATLHKSFDGYKKRVEKAVAEQAKKKVYVHRGADVFKPELVRNIKNVGVKPAGGLWASPQDTDFGWKEWCEAEDFYGHGHGSLDDSFKFTVAEPEKIFRVHDEESAKELLRKYYIPFSPHRIESAHSYGNDLPDKDMLLAWLDGAPKTGGYLTCGINIDFEAMERDGWVGFELTFSVEHWRLHELFDGWDCDSIVVFSPDQIELVD